MLNWPGSQLHLGSVNASNVNAVSILGSSASVWVSILVLVCPSQFLQNANAILNIFQWTTAGSEGITVYFPHRDLVASQWAWTVVIHEK